MKSVTADWVQKILPKRTNLSHKFTNGYLTAFVGSRNYPGAARLATYAAAQAGAGGVQLLIPDSLWPLVTSLQPEIIPILLEEYNGELTHVAAFDSFIAASARSTALLVGCGLGRSTPIIDFLFTILSHTTLPAVIDGDALFALGKWGKDFIHRFSQEQWILTPHKGELKKLLTDCGYILDQSNENLIELTRKFCQELNVVVVDKGFPTIIHTPKGESFVNPTGNPAASTAGCGDVLAGMISGLLAQGLDSESAAKAGTYMAGYAADEIVKGTGNHSLMASDLIQMIPKISQLLMINQTRS